MRAFCFDSFVCKRWQMKKFKKGCVLLGAAWFFSCAQIAFAEQAPVYDADSPAVMDNAPSDADLPPPPGPEGSDAVKSKSSRSMAQRSDLNSNANSNLNDRLSRIEDQLNAAQSATPNAKVEHLQTEIQTLRGEVEQLSHDLKQVQTELRSQSDDLQQRLSKLENNKTSASNSSLAVDKNQVNKIKNKKVKSDADADLASDQSDAVDKTVTTESTDNSQIDPAAKLSSDTQPAVSKKNKNKSKVSDVSNKADEVVGAASAQSDHSDDSSVSAEQALYQSAYGLIKQKKYPQAISTLQKMVSQYPAGQFSANAHYWLGELYGLSNKPSDAEREFNQVIMHYSKSARVPDAMLKVGLIYASEMKWAEAKSAFRKITKNYPGTPSARLAQQQLKEIKKLGN